MQPKYSAGSTAISQVVLRMKSSLLKLVRIPTAGY